MTVVLIVLIVAALAIIAFRMINSLSSKQREDAGLMPLDSQEDKQALKEELVVQSNSPEASPVIQEITLPPVAVPTTSAEIIVEEKPKKKRKYNKKPAVKQPQKKTPKKSKSL